MGVSSFHTHFKAITGTSPLQYQKDLRLMEAKQILMAGRHSVSSAAFEVGYESPTQFSREYKRKFGHPPATDLIAADRSDLSLIQSGVFSKIAS
jgi:AraC-like DNA-binding protein